VGVTLRYSSGQEAGPIELDTQFRGQTMLSSPDIETSTSLVLSGSGVPGPDAAASAFQRPSPLPEKGRRLPPGGGHSRCSRTRQLQLDILQY